MIIFFSFQMDQVEEFDFPLMKLLIKIFPKKDYFFSFVKVIFLEELVFLILQLLHLIIMYFIFTFPINFHQNQYPNQFMAHLFSLLPNHFINLILLVFFLNQMVNQVYDLLKSLNQIYDHLKSLNQIYDLLKNLNQIYDLLKNLDQIIINQMMVHPNQSKIINQVLKFIRYQIN